MVRRTVSSSFTARYTRIPVHIHSPSSRGAGVLILTEVRRAGRRAGRRQAARPRRTVTLLVTTRIGLRDGPCPADGWPRRRAAARARGRWSHAYGIHYTPASDRSLSKRPSIAVCPGSHRWQRQCIGAGPVLLPDVDTAGGGSWSCGLSPLEVPWVATVANPARPQSPVNPTAGRQAHLSGRRGSDGTFSRPLHRGASLSGDLRPQTAARLPCVPRSGRPALRGRTLHRVQTARRPCRSVRPAVAGGAGPAPGPARRGATWQAAAAD